METRLTHEAAKAETAVILRREGLTGPDLRFGETGVHIESSCLVRKRRLRMEICGVLSRTEGFSRSAADMSAEWLGHNIYYRLTRHPGAKSADIEFTGDKRWYVKLAAKVMGAVGLR